MVPDDEVLMSWCAGAFTSRTKDATSHVTSLRESLSVLEPVVLGMGRHPICETLVSGSRKREGVPDLFRTVSAPRTDERRRCEQSYDRQKFLRRG